MSESNEHPGRPVASRPELEQLEGLTVEALGQRYPFALSFLAEQGVELADEPSWTVGRALQQHQQSRGLDQLAARQLLRQLQEHITAMLEFVGEEPTGVGSLTIRSGRDKHGALESVTELTVYAGEVICLVGATCCHAQVLPLLAHHKTSPQLRPTSVAAAS